MSDLLDVTWRVVQALERLDIRYSIGGSLASSFSGEPRASIDADIVVELTIATADRLVEALGPDFYADVDALRRAVRSRSTANLIHRASGIKIDLFVAGTRLEQKQLERRQPVRIAGSPDRLLYVHSPEDILLQKLLWYQMGGGVSDRQWRDALSIAAVQGERLDREYLNTTSATVGLTDLLERLYREAERRR